MTPSELRAAWRNPYGTPPPPALGQSLMRRALAARCQEPEVGKFTQVELRELGALGRKDERRKEGRILTEAKWSGPHFFGLHSPRLGELKVAANG